MSQASLLTITGHTWLDNQSTSWPFPLLSSLQFQRQPQVNPCNGTQWHSLLPAVIFSMTNHTLTNTPHLVVDKNDIMGIRCALTDCSLKIKLLWLLEFIVRLSAGKRKQMDCNSGHIWARNIKYYGEINMSDGRLIPKHGSEFYSTKQILIKLFIGPLAEFHWRKDKFHHAIPGNFLSLGKSISGSI